MSVFRAWCEVRGVRAKVEALFVKELSELLPCFIMEARPSRWLALSAQYVGLC